MAAIYLDHNASTPVDPAVAAVMRPLIDTAYGNPSEWPLGQYTGEGRAGAGTRTGRGTPRLCRRRDRIHERR